MKSLISGLLGLLMLLGLAACSSNDGASSPPGTNTPSAPSSPPPSITVQPADRSVAAGAAASFSVSASGTIDSYRWQSSTDAGVTWSDVAGATTSTLAIPATKVEDNNLRLRVLITGAGTTVTSATARLTVTAPSGQPGSAPVILVHPVTVTVPFGESATFTVTAEGPDLSYQWWAKGEGWFLIPGATSATFRTGDYDVEINGGNSIRVEVTNPYGSVTSEEARIWYDSSNPGNPGGPSDPNLPPGCPGPQCIQPVPGASGLFPQAPNPLTATPTFGSVSSVTFRGWRKIQGGGVHKDDQVWEIALAPGVTATITMPWPTFLEDLDLQLTPVTSMDSLPFTSLVGAISIVNSEVEELGLAEAERPYTVTFNLTQDAAAAAIAENQTVFLADADGGNLHLVPVAREDASLTRISVQLDRLGIVGLAHATDGERQAALAHWPTADSDQFAASQAEIARLLRLDALATPVGAQSGKPLAKTRVVRAQAIDDDFRQQSIADLTSFYNDRVAPAVSAAYADHLLIGDAIRVMTEWSREVLLRGTEDPALLALEARIMPTVQNLLEIAADDIKAACRANGGGFDRVQQMLGMLRQLALQSMNAKHDELMEALNDCFRFRMEFSHERDRQVNSSATYAGGWYSNVNISTTANDTGSALLQGDALQFFSTVVGGAPEGPLGVTLSYNHSLDSESYNLQFVADPVWSEVPVRTTHHSTCHATENQVLGAKIKDFGLVRYPGGKRAVRLRLVDWGEGMIHCDANATTVITPWNGDSITQQSSPSTDSDYNTLTQTFFGFPDLRAVPGEFNTWEVLLKPEASGFRWQSTRSANGGGDQRREEFEITLHNDL